MIEGFFSRELFSELLNSKELGYYGVITSAAVLKFQRHYDVASNSELTSLRGRLVGPKTRRALNDIFSI
jgi:peptidoglycan hydrolase-like protein with peptidoglycan-binding domain